jgi:8-oxo-dGTP pyrophosphatase MutT (NUDIX family)
VTLATLCFILRDAPHPQILLGYKKRGFGQGKYDGFGGKVLEGEAIPAAALRELHEESGITVVPTDLSSFGVINFIFPNKPEFEQEVHVFLANKWTGIPLESEEMRPAWFPRSQLPYDQMWDDSHIWMPYVLSGQTIQATFTMNNDNETVKQYNMQLQ